MGLGIYQQAHSSHQSEYTSPDHLLAEGSFLWKGLGLLGVSEHWRPKALAAFINNLFADWLPIYAPRYGAFIPYSKRIAVFVSFGTC